MTDKNEWKFYRRSVRSGTVIQAVKNDIYWGWYPPEPWSNKPQHNVWKSLMSYNILPTLYEEFRVPALTVILIAGSLPHEEEKE